jgi:preprotein translocase subunit SecG
MIQFLNNMFNGSDTSIKRVIAFLGFLFIAITMLLNSYSHEDIKPSPDLVDAVKTIVLACLIGNVAEKFLKKNENEKI